MAAGALALSAGVATNAWAQEDPVNLVRDGDFSSWSWEWWTGDPSEVVDGELCIDVPGGTFNPWDSMLSQINIPLEEGESYELRFTARASQPVGVRVLVQEGQDPYTQVYETNAILSTESQTFTYGFNSGATYGNGQVAFQFGGREDPWQLCMDSVELWSGVDPWVYAPDTGPRVRVNQVQYLENGPKGATLATEATAPVPWRLNDAAGAVVASGSTEVWGDDPNAGEHVHTIDFSSVTATGEGFTITADGETSYPFAIGGGAYDDLAVDALSFYYPQRSGIAIDDAIAPGYGRPATSTSRRTPATARSRAGTTPATTPWT